MKVVYLIITYSAERGRRQSLQGTADIGPLPLRSGTLIGEVDLVN